MRGRREADERPEPRSLGLLPSGPDPVGEWLVHRQPPGPYICRGCAESKPRKGAATVTSLMALPSNCFTRRGMRRSISPEQIRMSPRFHLGPRPSLAYSASRIERAVDTRADAAALAALRNHPDARAYLIGGEMVALRKARDVHDPLFELREAHAIGGTAETVFIGLLQKAPRFALAIEPAAAEALKVREEFLVTDLRSIAVGGLIDGEHLPPLAAAKALLGWHGRHRFCPNCGARSHPVDGGWRRDCPSCSAQHFPRTDPVVIMLPVSAQSCLLGRSHRFQRGMWSCLAGFMEPGEAIEEAVRRETREEAGIECGRVRYFASQPWPFPSSLMIGCHAEALSREIVVDRAELDDARWFEREEVATMLQRCHPDGLTTPPGVAIAYHIIRAWVDNEIDLSWGS
jgi:NAD+ diphosphatase